MTIASILRRPLSLGVRRPICGMLAIGRSSIRWEQDTSTAPMNELPPESTGSPPVVPVPRVTGRKLPLWGYIVVGLSVCVFIVLLPFGLFIGHMTCFFLSANRVVDISGTITTPDGQPVNDVQLHVEQSTYVLFGKHPVGSPELPSTTRRDERTVNGQFTYYCRSCKYVELMFTKEGYFSERFVFLPGIAEKVKDIHVNHLNVVLEPEGRLPKLTHRGGTLRTSFKGPLTSLSLTKHGLDPQENWDRELQRSRAEDRTVVANVTLGVGFVAGTAKIGPYPDGPSEAYLIFSGPDDGAILYPVTERPTGDAFRIAPPDLRSMRDAPEGGYLQALPLEPTGNCHNHPNGHLFFFRIAGTYGKGRISLPCRDRDETVEADVDLWINPVSGDRNVAGDVS